MPRARIPATNDLRLSKKMSLFGHDFAKVRVRYIRGNPTLPPPAMFTAAVLDHTLNPRNAGELPNATHYGQFGIPGDGPYVQLWLNLSDGTILSASYATYGCPSAVACASLTCELLRGRNVDQAMLLEPKDLMLLLGGLPEGKEHCAKMAVDALRHAIRAEDMEMK